MLVYYSFKSYFTQTKPTLYIKYINKQVLLNFGGRLEILRNENLLCCTRTGDQPKSSLTLVYFVFY